VVISSRSAVLPRRTALVAVLAAALTVLGVLASPDARADSFTSPRTGTHAVGGAILAAYTANGGPTGLLGYPTTDELPTPRVFGRYNLFEAGSIYWSPGTGAHSIAGAIRDFWGRRGWENSSLGFPTTDAFAITGGVGQHFAAGSVTWSAGTGAHSISGAIRDAWAAKGGPDSYLHLPVTDEQRTPDGRGWFSHFQGGSVYWSAPTGAHVIGGAIRDAWARTGWERGRLGYPLTDETPINGGWAAHFQGGSIYWTPSTGAHVVGGAIRDAWATLGWELSPLGWPTSDEYAVPGGRRSDFQGGSLTWTPSQGIIPELTYRGTGTTVVRVPKGSAPMVANISYTGSGYFGVWTLDSTGEQANLLANTSGAWNGVIPLDFDPGWTPTATALQIQASGPWSIQLAALPAVAPFGKGQRVSEARSTVYHYVGGAGIAHITHDGSGYFGVISYDGRTTDYDDLLANDIGPTTLDVPIRGDVWLEVESDAPWSIQVY
jgi:hypothetical protein